jgi:hypothetical protein
MRAKCIDRPQFGQAGPTVSGRPATRDKFCIINMGAPHDALDNAILISGVLKRLIGIQTPV